MKVTIFLSLLLVSAITISVWLIHNNLRFSNAPGPRHAETPDSFMVNAVYLRYNKAGTLHDKFLIPRMVHYETRDITDFNNPQMIVYNDKKEPWHINADYGQSESGVDQVKLWGNVKIQQPTDPQNKGTTILTSSLIIFPKKQIAITDKPVTIKQPDALVNSVGLQANFKTGKIELLSHAHAIYNLKSDSHELAK